jgi:hypothetical protein
VTTHREGRCLFTGPFENDESEIAEERDLLLDQPEDFSMGRSNMSNNFPDARQKGTKRKYEAQSPLKKRMIRSNVPVIDANHRRSKPPVGAQDSDFERLPSPSTKRLRIAMSEVNSIHDSDDGDSTMNLSPRSRQRLAIFDAEVMHFG